MNKVREDIDNFSTLLANNIKQGKLRPHNESVFSILDTYHNSGEAIEKISKIISNKLYPEILLYKSKIIPAMNRLSNYFKEVINNSKVTPISSLFTISMTSLPNIIEEVTDKSYSLAGGPIKDLPNTEPVNLPEIENDIRQYFIFSKAKYNAYLEEILSRKTTSELNSIYEKYFENISSSNTFIKDILKVGLSNVSGGETLVLILSLLDYYLINKPGDLIDNPKSISILTEYQYNVVRALKHIKDIYKNIRSAKKVILWRTDKDILVDKDLYDDFISSGGSADSILGWSISHTNDDIVSMTKDDLIKNKFKLEADWAAFVEKSKLAVSSLLIDKVKTNILTNFNRIWSEYYPEEMKEEVNKDDIENLFYDFVNENLPSILNYTTFSRKIMGEVFFPHTNFKIFSECMHNYLMSDPDISPKNAATFSIIDMVIEYLTNQLVLDNAH